MAAVVTRPRSGEKGEGDGTGDENVVRGGGTIYTHAVPGQDAGRAKVRFTLSRVVSGSGRQRIDVHAVSGNGSTAGRNERTRIRGLCERREGRTKGVPAGQNRASSRGLHGIKHRSIRIIRRGSDQCCGGANERHSSCSHSAGDISGFPVERENVPEANDPTGDRTDARGGAGKGGRAHVSKAFSRQSRSHCRRRAFRGCHDGRRGTPRRRACHRVADHEREVVGCVGIVDKVVKLCVEARDAIDRRGQERIVGAENALQVRDKRVLDEKDRLTKGVPLGRHKAGRLDRISNGTQPATRGKEGWEPKNSRFRVRDGSLSGLQIRIEKGDVGIREGRACHAIEGRTDHAERRGNLLGIHVGNALEDGLREIGLALRAKVRVGLVAPVTDGLSVSVPEAALGGGTCAGLVGLHAEAAAHASIPAPDTSGAQRTLERDHGAPGAAAVAVKDRDAPRLGAVIGVVAADRPGDVIKPKTNVRKKIQVLNSE